MTLKHSQTTIAPWLSFAQKLARFLLRLEPLVLALTLLAFWHHSPPIRDRWVDLILLFPVMCGLRYIAYRRLWTLTPLIPWLLAFILLTHFNFHNAPFSRADYWVLVCRPLVGIWLVIYFGEVTRNSGQLTVVLTTSVLFGVLLAGVALSATQWTNKSEVFDWLTTALPRLNHREILPDMMLSFNPNEIAGALAWFTPLMAGLAFYRHPPRWVRPLATLASVLLFLALMLGQSRFAIGGVISAFGLLSLFAVRSWRWRGLLLAAVTVIITIEAAILFNVFQPTSIADQNTLSQRDQRTATNRLDLWDRGLQMTLDYPLTGAGMSMYRSAVRTADYVIPYYEAENRGPPHAHSQWIQVGADLGIPGLLIFAAWHISIVWMLWQAWKTEQRGIQVIALAIAAGFIGHAGYGIGDTVTLWDRFHFIWWWLIALANALFIHVKGRKPV